MSFHDCLTPICSLSIVYPLVLLLFVLKLHTVTGLLKFGLNFVFIVEHSMLSCYGSFELNVYP